MTLLPLARGPKENQVPGILIHPTRRPPPIASPRPSPSHLAALPNPTTVMPSLPAPVTPPIRPCRWESWRIGIPRRPRPSSRDPWLSALHRRPSGAHSPLSTSRLPLSAAQPSVRRCSRRRSPKGKAEILACLMHLTACSSHAWYSISCKMHMLSDLWTDFDMRLALNIIATGIATNESDGLEVVLISALLLFQDR